jgi:hypothetical protein
MMNLAFENLKRFPGTAAELVFRGTVRSGLWRKSRRLIASSKRDSAASVADASPFEPTSAAGLARTVDALRRRLGDRFTALEQQGCTGTMSAVIGLIVDCITALTATA